MFYKHNLIESSNNPIDQTLLLLSLHRCVCWGSERLSKLLCRCVWVGDSPKAKSRDCLYFKFLNGNWGRGLGPCSLVGKSGLRKAESPTFYKQDTEILPQIPPPAMTQGRDPLWGGAWFSHLQKKGLDSLYINVPNSNALQGQAGDKNEWPESGRDCWETGGHMPHLRGC